MEWDSAVWWLLLMYSGVGGTGEVIESIPDLLGSHQPWQMSSDPPLRVPHTLLCNGVRLSSALGSLS